MSTGNIAVASLRVVKGENSLMLVFTLMNNSHTDIGEEITIFFPLPFCHSMEFAENGLIEQQSSGEIVSYLHTHVGSDAPIMARLLFTSFQHAN